MNEKKVINYRFLARIVFEAETPLSVKSGDKDIYTDSVVMRDVNGLPYIPGSSLAGVMRHAWQEAKKDGKDLFGFQDGDNSGQGSRIIFSEARVLNSVGVVMDGLNPDAYNDDLLKFYDDLPVRQHVRINHLGVAANTGKFNEQVVFAGTRFCFEMEILETEPETEVLTALNDIYYKSKLRLGSGTRKGFGKIKIVSVDYIRMDMKDLRYLTKSSNLENSKEWYKANDAVQLCCLSDSSAWEGYELELTPDDFFLFGSGFGDDEADMIPVKEQKVKWDDDGETMKGRIEDYSYLLPASSIKGAIAHRVAFHYNKQSGIFVDDFKNKKEEMEANVGKNNIAVRLLFGSEGIADKGKLRGNVILSDLFVDQTAGKEKILNHVAIDRFTGGAIDGALFSEKTVYGRNMPPFRLKIMVDKENIKRQITSLGLSEEMFKNVIGALEKSIDDICLGFLPLGGRVNRGNGIFSGKKIDKMKGGIK